MSIRKRLHGGSPPEVAGNGLIDRRALLGRGVPDRRRDGRRASAARSPAPPPSRFRSIRGASRPAPHPALWRPAKYEKKVVRTLTNPKNEPRTSQARTPHHLLNGTITPNGLHFVVSRTGFPDIDPDKHRLVIHGLVKQPLVFDARGARALSDGVARQLRRMRRQQRAALQQGPGAGQRAGDPRPRSPAPNGPACGSRRCSKRPASTRRRSGCSRKAPTGRA